MSDAQFGFHFEDAGLGLVEGPVSAEEQHFEGSVAEESLVRELTQNALDAAHPDSHGVVRMVFEMRAVSTGDLPDIERLRAHINAAAEQHQQGDGTDRLHRARAAAASEAVMVLRVGDYGTTGLRGSEGKDDTGSALVALTRSAGTSAGKASGGGAGSFGIGKAAGTMSADLCTVLWTSKADDKPDVVFAGHSRLAGHRLNDRQVRAAGFYLRVDGKQEDFQYLRNPRPIGPFPARTEVGTDVYILGYRSADHDPELHHIRNAFISNFMAAIHRGRLVVEGYTPTGQWVLDESTLPSLAEGLDHARPFYRALQDRNPYTKELPSLGECRLYVEVDDSFPHKFHTMTMRAQLMRICTYRHNTIRQKYAAVMECSGVEGNKLLRALEPPLHNDWDAGRGAANTDVSGTKLVKAVKDFIRDGLRSKINDEVGDEVEIHGLSALLPSSLGGRLSMEHAPGLAIVGEGSDHESATVQGGRSPVRKASTRSRKTSKATVVKPAVGSGEEPIEKGKDAGGSGTRADRTPGLPGTGDEGNGSSRIRAGAVQMRSWAAADGTLVMTLRAPEAVSGDLTLAAVSDAGTIERDYALPIGRVWDVTDGHPRELETEGNTIKALQIASGEPMRLRVELNEQRRFLLGVM